MQKKKLLKRGIALGLVAAMTLTMASPTGILSATVAEAAEIATGYTSASGTPSKADTAGVYTNAGTQKGLIAVGFKNDADDTNAVAEALAVTEAMNVAPATKLYGSNRGTIDSLGTDSETIYVAWDISNEAIKDAAFYIVDSEDAILDGGAEIKSDKTKKYMARTSFISRSEIDEKDNGWRDISEDGEPKKYTMLGKGAEAHVDNPIGEYTVYFYHWTESGATSVNSALQDKTSTADKFAALQGISASDDYVKQSVSITIDKIVVTAEDDALAASSKPSDYVADTYKEGTTYTYAYEGDTIELPELADGYVYVKTDKNGETALLDEDGKITNEDIVADGDDFTVSYEAKELSAVVADQQAETLTYGTADKATYAFTADVEGTFAFSAGTLPSGVTTTAETITFAKDPEKDDAIVGTVELTVADNASATNDEGEELTFAISDDIELKTALIIGKKQATIEDISLTAGTNAALDGKAFTAASGDTAPITATSDKTGFGNTITLYYGDETTEDVPESGENLKIYVSVNDGTNYMGIETPEDTGYTLTITEKMVEFDADSLKTALQKTDLNKTYDGNSEGSATLEGFQDKAGTAHDVTVSFAYADKDSADNKTITIKDVTISDGTIKSANLDALKAINGLTGDIKPIRLSVDDDVDLEGGIYFTRVYNNAVMTKNDAVNSDEQKITSLPIKTDKVAEGETITATFDAANATDDLWTKKDVAADDYVGYIALTLSDATNYEFASGDNKIKVYGNFTTFEKEFTLDEKVLVPANVAGKKNEDVLDLSAVMSDAGVTATGAANTKFTVDWGDYDSITAATVESDNKVDITFGADVVSGTVDLTITGKDKNNYNIVVYETLTLTSRTQPTITVTNTSQNYGSTAEADYTIMVGSTDIKSKLNDDQITVTYADATTNEPIDLETNPASAWNAGSYKVTIVVDATEYYATKTDTITVSQLTPAKSDFNFTDAQIYTRDATDTKVLENISAKIAELEGKYTVKYHTATSSGASANTWDSVVKSDSATTYYVYVETQATTNYSAVSGVSAIELGTIIIKAENTWKADKAFVVADFVYDGTTTAADKITGEPEHGSFSAANVKYKVYGADDSTYDGDAPKNAGKYTAQATVTEDDYAPLVATADFEITKMPVTITPEDATFDASAEDFEEKIAGLTYTATDLATGDSFATTPVCGVDSAVDGKTNGDYEISITNKSEIAATSGDNYEFTLATGTLTVSGNAEVKEDTLAVTVNTFTPSTNGASGTFTANKAGTYYWIASTTPLTIENLSDAETAYANAAHKGTGEYATAGNPQNVSITGLTSNTTYNLYVAFLTADKEEFGAQSATFKTTSGGTTPSSPSSPSTPSTPSNTDNNGGSDNNNNGGDNSGNTNTSTTTTTDPEAGTTTTTTTTTTTDTATGNSTSTATAVTKDTTTGETLSTTTTETVTNAAAGETTVTETVVNADNSGEITVTTTNTSTGASTSSTVVTDTSGAATEIVISSTNVNGKTTTAEYDVTSGTNVTLDDVETTTTKITVPATVAAADGKTYKVTAVAKNAAKNNATVKTVVIGKNVRTVGASAFAGCKKLTKATVGANVTKIAKNTFKGDSKLKTITLQGAKVTSIGKNAFSGIAKNATITIKGSAKQVKKVTNLIKKSGVAKTVMIKRAK